MEDTRKTDSTDMDVARAVRDACMEVSKEAFQDALMRGLCSEGAIEAAVGAIQSLDVESIIAEVNSKK